MSSLLCWLLGHAPKPRWNGEDPWCGRCGRYVESEGCRDGALDRAVEMFAREHGGRE